MCMHKYINACILYDIKKDTCVLLVFAAITAEWNENNLFPRTAAAQRLPWNVNYFLVVNWHFYGYCVSLWRSKRLCQGLWVTLWNASMSSPAYIYIHAHTHLHTPSHNVYICLLLWVLHPLLNEYWFDLIWFDLLSNVLCAFDFGLFTVVLSAPRNQPSFLVQAWDWHRTLFGSCGGVLAVRNCAIKQKSRFKFLTCRPVFEPRIFVV